MERYSDSISRRCLTFVVVTFIAMTFLGCNDPMVKEMEARRQEVGFFAEQELQRCRNAIRQTNRVKPLPQAQVADMEAERRELDRMVERGDWQSFVPQQSNSRASLSRPEARMADMEAERRELERMIERGEYYRMSPTAQSDLFYQAP